MDEYRLHPSLVTHWKAGQLEPWPEAASATETIWFALPKEPNGVTYWEGLNGRIEGDGTVTVLGVPAFAYDLNLGDRVTAIKSAEGPLVATSVAHNGGNHTFRIFLLGPEDETAWYPLAQEFARMGCLVDVLSPRLIAISCPMEPPRPVVTRLCHLRDEGILDYETSSSP